MMTKLQNLNLVTKIIFPQNMHTRLLLTVCMGVLLYSSFLLLGKLLIKSETAPATVL